MNLYTQKAIKQIFVQFAIALAAFVGLGVLAKADTLPQQPATQIEAQLFESRGTQDLKAYQAAQRPFTAAQIALVDSLDLNRLSTMDNSDDYYDVDFRFDALVGSESLMTRTTQTSQEQLAELP